MLILGWMVDNPSGAECYGLSTSAMVSWIANFSITYHSATGMYAFSLFSSIGMQSDSELLKDTRVRDFLTC